LLKRVLVSLYNLVTRYRSKEIYLLRLGI
jgi:hypothetical protein